MKQTVAISTFAGMLARQSGYTADFCERFVVEMFKTVADALKDSNEVSIKGLGKFSADEAGNVEFTPDLAFAADVNAPFECFEPEPLDDDITDDMLSSGEDDDRTVVTEEDIVEEPSETPTVSDDDSYVEDIEVDSTAETTEMPTETISDTTICPIDESVDDTIDPGLSSQMLSSENAEMHEDVELPANDGVDEAISDENTEYPAKRRRTLWAFVCGVAVGAIIGAAATYIAITPRAKSETNDQIRENEQEVAEELGEISPVAPIDTIAVQPEVATAENMEAEKTEKKDSVVYDTVTTTLAQLSRKHFGSYEFWVYIYEENRDVISNPDKVESGTRVRIPDVDKYDIDANDRNSINKALKKSQEISGRKK
ncbi:MAG: HU family DNA-binding protein [Muribaculaceae bacterium]|nr:HU family DNA-binding protein [Muribaculaceae bacterium]